MQHYSTTGRVLACTSSSYPPSTYSYGALLVMQRIMSFFLLVHHSQHSWHDRLTHSSTSAKRHGDVALPEYTYTTSTSISPRTSCRTSWSICIYMYHRNSSIRRTHTQNGPRERWPHLCMHSRNALLPGISTCRPAEHYSILLCMQREHVALLVY